MKLVSYKKSKRKNAKNIKAFNILPVGIIALLAVISIIVACINIQQFALIVAGILCFIGYGSFFIVRTWIDIIFFMSGIALWVLFVICYPYISPDNLGYAFCEFILLWIVVIIIGVMFERKHIKKEATREKRNTYRKITKLSKSAKSKQDFQNFITPQQAEKEKKAK